MSMRRLELMSRGSSAQSAAHRWPSLGHLRTPSFGALLYNAAHSYPLPGLLGAAAVGAGLPVPQALAAVWFTHIGLDRAFGYGLKHDGGFAHTHHGTSCAAGLGAAHASRIGR